MRKIRGLTSTRISRAIPKATSSSSTIRTPTAAPPARAATRFASPSRCPDRTGGSFVAQSNDAVTVQVTNQGGAADPYAFFDGSQYILYVPTFNGPLPLQQISVYTSPTIGGPYTLFRGLPSGALSTGGGQASGFHNAALGQYWHYENGVSAVYEAIASTLDQQISLPPQPPAPPGGR